MRIMRNASELQIRISEHFQGCALCGLCGGYCIAGMFGEFGESSMIRQTKTIQISTYN